MPRSGRRAPRPARRSRGCRERAGDVRHRRDRWRGWRAPRLELVVQARRAVDPRPTEKGGEDRAAPRRELRRRHEGVLGADLAFVLGEARGAGAEHGEIDVDEQRRVGAGRQRRVARRQDERRRRARRRRARRRRQRRRAQPVGAALLVVGSLHVVDGVVEPEAGLDLGRDARPGRRRDRTARCTRPGAGACGSGAAARGTPPSAASRTASPSLPAPMPRQARRHELVRSMLGALHARARACRGAHRPRRRTPRPRCAPGNARRAARR